MGRSWGLRSPVRPCASWTVATPRSASWSTIERSVRAVPVTTTATALLRRGLAQDACEPDLPGILIPLNGTRRGPSEGAVGDSVTSKVLSLLETFTADEPELTLTQLSDRTGLPRP